MWGLVATLIPQWALSFFGSILFLLKGIIFWVFVVKNPGLNILLSPGGFTSSVTFQGKSICIISDFIRCSKFLKSHNYSNFRQVTVIPFFYIIPLTSGLEQLIMFSTHCFQFSFFFFKFSVSIYTNFYYKKQEWFLWQFRICYSLFCEVLSCFSFFAVYNSLMTIVCSILLNGLFCTWNLF